MKQEKTRLFAIADPTASHQAALVKALLLAKLADCQIHAFLCVYREGGEDDKDSKHNTLVDAGQWLDGQLEPCRTAGVPFSKQVVWDSQWHDAALRAIAKSECDLVIKSSYHHSKSKRFYSSTSDFNLMRHCACPILFTHPTQEWDSNELLACVDLESTDVGHARLNDVIIRDARAMASIVGMDLHIAAAHQGSINPDNLPIESQGGEVSAQQLAELYDVDASRIHLRQGETVATLSAICAEIDPCIVIIGTLARTGISGQLIGNTAEKLLDRVEADVLTVN